ncbi:MAG: Ig domain-containing protein [bacterium]
MKKNKHICFIFLVLFLAFLLTSNVLGGTITNGPITYEGIPDVDFTHSKFESVFAKNDSIIAVEKERDVKTITLRMENTGTIHLSYLGDYRDKGKNYIRLQNSSTGEVLFERSMFKAGGDIVKADMSNFNFSLELVNETFRNQPAGLYELKIEAEVSNDDFPFFNQGAAGVYAHLGTVEKPNEPPQFVNMDTEVQKVNAGEELSFAVTASDPDRDDRLIVTKVNGPGRLMPLDDTENGNLEPHVYEDQLASVVMDNPMSEWGHGRQGTRSYNIYSWHTRHSDIGEHFVTFRVSDGKASNTITIPIEVLAINEPPELGKIGDKYGYRDVPIRFNIIAFDPNEDELTYSASGELAEYFNPENQVFSWTPEEEDVGGYSITFDVTDGEHVTSETINVFVNYKQPPEEDCPPCPVNLEECYERRSNLSNPDAEKPNVPSLERN